MVCITLVPRVHSVKLAVGLEAAALRKAVTVASATAQGTHITPHRAIAHLLEVALESLKGPTLEARLSASFVVLRWTLGDRQGGPGRKSGSTSYLHSQRAFSLPFFCVVFRAGSYQWRYL